MPLHLLAPIAAFKHLSLLILFLVSSPLFPSFPPSFSFLLPSPSLHLFLLSFSPSFWDIGLDACVLSHVQVFVTPWTVARQALLSMGFPRQEYWSGLICPLPGDLSNPGIESTSPALAGSSLTLNHQGSPVGLYSCCLNFLPSSFLFSLPGGIKKREREIFFIESFSSDADIA